MTRDLTIPARWIEGHIAALDHREAGCEHAIRAALSEADAAPHWDELAEVRRIRGQWRDLQLLVVSNQPRRLKETR